MGGVVTNNPAVLHEFSRANFSKGVYPLLKKIPSAKIERLSIALRQYARDQKPGGDYYLIVMILLFNS